MAQTNINIRMDDALKRDFCALCDEFGLSMTAAINVFAKTVVRTGKIPFEISSDVPNEETRAAFREADEMLRNPHLFPGFHSVEALFEELNSDD